MKKILVVSDVDCSKNNYAGNKFAVTKLINYLSIKHSVLYLNLNRRKPSGFVNVKCTRFFGVIHSLERRFFNKKKSLLDYKKTISSRISCWVIDKFYKPDVVIVEYLEFSYLTNCFKSAIKICDTHDIMHKRKNSYIDAGQKVLSYFDIDLNSEVKALGSFDYVLAIQHEDYEYLNKILYSYSIPILCPRAQDISIKNKVNDRINTLGFVGGKGESNLESVKWLLENWSDIVKLNRLKLVIAGGVCDLLESYILPEGVELLGKIENMECFYQLVDVSINPVMFGSGLKIKNIESICCGVPVLTTDIGLQGLDVFESEVIFKFSNVNDISRYIDEINGFNFLPTLSYKCHEMAMENFSPDRCFSELNRIIGS